jgi:hypothetical protein
MVRAVQGRVVRGRNASASPDCRAFERSHSDDRVRPREVEEESSASSCLLIYYIVITGNIINNVIYVKAMEIVYGMTKWKNHSL